MTLDVVGRMAFHTPRGNSLNLLAAAPDLQWSPCILRMLWLLISGR